MSESAGVTEARDRSGRRYALDQAATAFGVVLLVIVAAAAPLWAALSGMRSEGCADACDYTLVGTGSGIIALVPAAITIAVVILLVVRSSSGRPLAWLCGVGLVVAIAVIAVGEAVVTAGV